MKFNQQEPATTTTFYDANLNYIVKCDHNNVEYCKEVVVWVPYQVDFYYVEAGDRQIMKPIIIKELNLVEPPTYQVVEENDLKSEEVFELPQKYIYYFKEKLDEIIKNNLSEEEKIKYLKASSFKTTIFKKTVLDLRLENDHVSNVKTFYDVICDAAKTSHAFSIRILPNFKDLRPNHPIKKMMVPSGKSICMRTQNTLLKQSAKPSLFFSKAPNQNLL